MCPARPPLSQSLQPHSQGPYLVARRPRSFDDVAALFVPHFKYRGIYEIPGKIIQEMNAWQRAFHELILSLAQPVPVPGFHSSRVAARSDGAVRA